MILLLCSSQGSHKNWKKINEGQYRSVTNAKKGPFCPDFVQFTQKWIFLLLLFNFTHGVLILIFWNKIQLSNHDLNWYFELSFFTSFYAFSTIVYKISVRTAIITLRPLEHNLHHQTSVLSCFHRDTKETWTHRLQLGPFWRWCCGSER